MSTFTSYAQNFEDVLLWRALKDVESGFYIDIGANSPVVDSVSLAFYQNGWTGINVEPSLEYSLELRDKRKKDVNVQAAISEERGLLKFYDIPETGLSTLLEEVADQHVLAGFQVREEIVPVITLDDLLQDISSLEVHWMKIDVEGAEQQVLQGWKTSPVRPWIVVVESVLPSSHVESHAEWESLLLAKGYQFAYFDGLNRYFIAENHLDLLNAFQVGPNVFDRFCLSGTATSTFCAIVNHKALEVAEDLSATTVKLSETTAQLSETRDRLSESIERRELAERALNERDSEYQQAIAFTKVQLEESQQTNASLCSEFAFAKNRFNEREAEHQQAIASLYSKFALAENESNELRKRMIETLSEYRGLIQDRNQAQGSLIRQGHQLSVSKAEIEALRTEQATLMANLRSSSQRIGSLESMHGAAEAKIEEILSSSSWKLTAPLRFLAAILRGSQIEKSSYSRETLRNLAEVPAFRKLALRLLPKNGRFKRFLAARMQSGATGRPALVAGHLQPESLKVAGGERGRLLRRMATRIRDDRYRMERLK